MNDFKTGDILELRDMKGVEFEYCKTPNTFHNKNRKWGSLEEYSDYKHNKYHWCDIVKHSRDGKVLYREFNLKVPTEDTPVDTKVLVWNTDISYEEALRRREILYRYFSNISNNGSFECFRNGATSWTTTATARWFNAVIWEEGMDE